MEQKVVCVRPFHIAIPGGEGDMFINFNAVVYQTITDHDFTIEVDLDGVVLIKNSEVELEYESGDYIESFRHVTSEVVEEQPPRRKVRPGKPGDRPPAARVKSNGPQFKGVPLEKLSKLAESPVAVLEEEPEEETEPEDFDLARAIESMTEEELAEYQEFLETQAAQ